MIEFDFTGSRYTKEHLSRDKIVIIPSDRSRENTAALKYILSNNQRITEVSFKLENSAGVTRWFKDEIEELLKNKDSLEVLSFVSESYDHGFLAAILRIIGANKNLKSLTNFKSFHTANGGFTTENFVFFFNNFPANNSIEVIRLDFCTLGDNGAIALAGALAEKLRVKRLNFTKTGITEKGATAIAAALKSNFNIRVLNIGRNDIGDAGGVAFAELLACNSSIIEFTTYCDIGAVGTKAIASALQHENCKLQKLEIGDGIVDDKVAAELANGLRVNTNLRSLALLHVRIALRGLVLICEALEESRTIRSLNLRFDLSGKAFLPVAKLLRNNRSLVELDVTHCSLSDAEFRDIQENVSSNESSRLHSLAIELPSGTAEMATVLERFATSGRRNVCSIAFQNHRLHVNQFQAFYDNYLRSDWVKRLKRIFEANPSFKYDYVYTSNTAEFDYNKEAVILDDLYKRLVENIGFFRSVFGKMRHNPELGRNVHIHIKPTIQEVYNFPYTIISFARFAAGGYARLRFELFNTRNASGQRVCEWEEAEDLVKMLSEIMPHIFYRDVFLYGLPENEKRRQFVVYMNDSQIKEKQLLKLAMPIIALQFFSNYSVQ